jgi:ATPase subunit of ABC transporter with duplicated ATPase domains
VVSHDRYFIERVTDQQYAILERRLRHLPGGVDEYLRLRALEEQRRGAPAGPTGSRGRGTADSTAPSGSGGGTADGGAAGGGAADAARLQGAALRDAQKEIASIERRLGRLTERIDAERTALAEHDQSDYVGLGVKTEEIGALEHEAGELEERWFERTEAIG